MKILFCNITYLRYYDGRVAGELKPTTGGRWVQENEDAHEKWNFLNMDGKCYGYVQGLSDRMHIERIDNTSKNEATAEDITVVWCASNGEKTVVVGWYEHATAYRECQSYLCTPISGIDRYYWFETKAENAYLLPENMRTFEIGRASKTGSGTGFGQYNYWFADSEYAKREIVPLVEEFISQNRAYRINTQTSEFVDTGDKTPLTPDEQEYVSRLSQDQNKEYLKYGYRIYANDMSADNAYAIASALYMCHQYNLSIPWYEKTIELDPDDFSTMEILTYIYQQCEMYDKSTKIAEVLLEKLNPEKSDIRDELYCILADNCFRLNHISKAIEWQNKIIEESRDKDLIEHTKKVKSVWELL